MYVHNDDVTYFDSFGVEHIPKEIKHLLTIKTLKQTFSEYKHANIFRIQAYDSIMCGYFCIGFIDYMLAGKKLTDYTNLFTPYVFEKNDDIIFTYFKNR